MRREINKQVKPSVLFNFTRTKGPKMNLTTKRINLRRALFSGAALASMLGGMILTASSAKAVGVTTAANLSEGVSYISVDLREFVQKDYRDKAVKTECKGNLDSGILAIKCNLSKYVKGEGYAPFSTSLYQGASVKILKANLDQGIERINVDLKKFLKKDLEKLVKVREECKGNLDSGTLTIKCNLSKYVKGDGFSPFSKSNIKTQVELQETNTNR